MESDQLQIARLLMMRIDDHAMYGELKSICRDLIKTLEKIEQQESPEAKRSPGPFCDR